MSIDDESSRLKHFIWEELDEQFFLAVIFRCVCAYRKTFFQSLPLYHFSSGRRYVVQRHFEQQLYDIKSPIIQSKWRRCLFEVISKPIYLTRSEVDLMHEIFSWHLNSPSIKLRENIDYMIDFEDLIDCFHSNTNHDGKSFLVEPVTTLDAARKNIEMWKNLQENFIEKTPPDNQIPRKPANSAELTRTSSKSSTTGWLQLDSKIVPFIKKHCDRLLPVEYLLKEHVISSSEDFSLRSLYIPISPRRYSNI